MVLCWEMAPIGTAIAGSLGPLGSNSSDSLDSGTLGSRDSASSLSGPVASQHGRLSRSHPLGRELTRLRILSLLFEQSLVLLDVAFGIGGELALDEVLEAMFIWKLIESATSAQVTKQGLFPRTHKEKPRYIFAGVPVPGVSSASSAPYAGRGVSTISSSLPYSAPGGRAERVGLCLTSRSPPPGRSRLCRPWLRWLMLVAWVEWSTNRSSMLALSG